MNTNLRVTETNLRPDCTTLHQVKDGFWRYAFLKSFPGHPNRVHMTHFEKHFSKSFPQSLPTLMLHDATQTLSFFLPILYHFLNDWSLNYMYIMFKKMTLSFLL